MLLHRFLLNVTDQDFIALMGGGERAADEVLRQTLEFAFALGASESKPKGAGEAINNGNLQNEISGVGFGGALLHLLRVGSISSLYVVQVQKISYCFLVLHPVGERFVVNLAFVWRQL